jgi:aquaporin Z
MAFSDMSKCAVEFVGTFLLCFTVAFTAGRDSLAALAIGTVLAIAVYGGGYISGGHYNPAVSFACLLCGKSDIKGWASNTVSQFLGALVAGQVAKTMLGEGKFGYPAVGEDFTSNDAIITECICTAFLCLVVLGSACSARTAGKDFYGYAIGMTVFACAVSSGRISGGAFNPAVGTLGFANSDTSDLSIYFIGPYLGAIVAAICYRLVSPSDVPNSDNGGNMFSNYNINIGSDGQKLVAELLGTFFLTYTVAMCAGGEKLAAFAIGTSLTTSIYGLGFVSGGHFNPAVTVGLAVHGKHSNNADINWKETATYIIAQVVGACLATGLASNISDISVGMPAAGHIAKGIEYGTGTVICAEVIATATLVYTILNCCCSSQAGNNYFGYAIGGTVFVMASAVGHVSGGGFNPAVCTACMLINHVHDTLWIYWVAPILGGIVAAGIYKFTHTEAESAAAAAPAAASAAAPAKNDVPTDAGSML